MRVRTHMSLSGTKMWCQVKHWRLYRKRTGFKWSHDWDKVDCKLCLKLRRR